MAQQILLVEDDRSVREAVSLVLERSGFAVHAVPDGSRALDAIDGRARFDLVVLDLMLPGLSGFDVCREIRRTSSLPIVMLTARTDVADIVAGLELGADDYLTKPFEPAELAARVRSVLRRANADPEDNGAEELRVRDITIDERAFRAFRRDEEIPLTAMEFRLLSVLARNAGAVVTRDVLLERVWGYDYLGDSRLVDMAVKRLRDKLGDPLTTTPYVGTVRGVGYRFERD